MNSKLKLQKTLYIILLLICAGCFVLGRFISEATFILISVLALLASVAGEKSKYAMAAAIGAIIITLEFLKVLPMPYNYLFDHGLKMGPAMLITAIVALFYVVLPVVLVIKWKK